MRTLDEAIQDRKEEKARAAKRLTEQCRSEDQAREKREQEAANLVAAYLSIKYDVEWPDDFRFVTTGLRMGETGRFYLTIHPGPHGRIDLRRGFYVQVVRGELTFERSPGMPPSLRAIWQAVGRDNYRCYYENLIDAIIYATGNR